MGMTVSFAEYGLGEIFFVNSKDRTLRFWPRQPCKPPVIFRCIVYIMIINKI